MNKIKSILAILAAVMSVSLAYAQENTAEAVPAQQANTEASTQTSTVPTKFGSAIVTKTVSANSTNLQVSLGSVPAGSNSSDVVRTVHSIAAEAAAGSVHVPAIHAMSAAVNANAMDVPEGARVALNAILPNAATENPSFTFTVNGNTARYTPTVAPAENATNVSGNFSMTDENGANAIRETQLTVPADGSNLTGRIGGAAVEVPPANFIARPDTARPDVPTAEATQVDNPDLTVRIGKGELTPEN